MRISKGGSPRVAPPIAAKPGVLLVVTDLADRGTDGPASPRPLEFGVLTLGLPT